MKFGFVSHGRPLNGRVDAALLTLQHHGHWFAPVIRENLSVRFFVDGRDISESKLIERAKGIRMNAQPNPVENGRRESPARARPHRPE
jgi:hypothetical protein